MSAFRGTDVPPEVAARLAERPIAGFTLFRAHNVESVAQVRSLTAALQAAAPPDARPLLIAADQEGGQLVGLGEDTTPFAGPMALGATGDADLAERVARATALELRALGVNVNYAPVCDLATDSRNPALGIRSFGDDPEAVGRLAAATVRGLQAEGVAATAKHFPGVGDLTVDTHHALGVVRHDRVALEARELVSFRAALAAGARFVMSGHFALPALTGDPELPATLAPGVMTSLLREVMGFEGLAITDALDMHALGQGAAQVVDVICAVRAGVDLLLCAADDAAVRIEPALDQALRRGLIDPAGRGETRRRLYETRAWLAGFERPPPEVVGAAEHAVLARELAERSVTLLRNGAGLVPLRPTADDQLLVIQPRPTDLTPADTSSYVDPSLAEAVRRRHPATDGLLLEQTPDEGTIAHVRARAADFGTVILGTVVADRQPGQAALARALIGDGRRVVNVALRTPWDVAAFPEAQTYACSYGILGPSMEATAAALFGEIPFSGHLPVAIAGLHARGEGLAR